MKAIVTGLATLTLFALAAGSSAAVPAGRLARLPCVEFDTSLGEYGAYVFELLDKPSSCTEYKGNVPSHATESLLTRIHWRNWGSAKATARATWHYCGMGTCIYRPAHLIAYRVRNRCGEPVYTRLRMKLPAAHRFGTYHVLFRLPACGGAFDYI